MKTQAVACFASLAWQVDRLLIVLLVASCSINGHRSGPESESVSKSELMMVLGSRDCSGAADGDGDGATSSGCRCRSRTLEPHWHAINAVRFHFTGNRFLPA